VAIDPAKAFKKPAAEKSRAASDEKTFSADFLPQLAGPFEDEVEITGEETL
jgi:hypothetical protein